MRSTDFHKKNTKAESFVITISGPSGCGKTTLVRKVAELLDDAAILFFDDYEATGKWLLDIRTWYEKGCDPNQLVSFPEMVEALKTLRDGGTIVRPETTTMPGGAGEIVGPARFIVMEDPWGRERNEISPFIDYVAHIDVPLVVALCRRLLREQKRGRDPMRWVTWYLETSRHIYFSRQQEVCKSADLVLDGLKTPEELAKEVVSNVQQHLEKARS